MWFQSEEDSGTDNSNAPDQEGHFHRSEFREGWELKPSEDTGLDTALRIPCHSEPSFLRNINSSYTHSHLENWIPLLFMERGRGSRIRFPVLANSVFPRLSLLPRSQDSL